MHLDNVRVRHGDHIRAEFPTSHFDTVIEDGNSVNRSGPLVIDECLSLLADSRVLRVNMRFAIKNSFSSSSTSSPPSPLRSLRFLQSPTRDQIKLLISLILESRLNLKGVSCPLVKTSLTTIPIAGDGHRFDRGQAARTDQTSRHAIGEKLHRER